MELEEENKRLEKLCDNLDELTMKQADLVDEQLKLMSNVSRLLTSGFIDLAKSRYINGEKTVSTTQIPGEDSDIEAVTTTSRDSTNTLTLLRNEEGNDPIKWFGVLVPSSLRQSQQTFRKAIEIAIEVINIRREWLESIAEYQTLSDLKSSSHGKPEHC